MNTIRNMHEVIFPNIYILLDIIYYMVRLVRIIALAVITVGFKGQTNTLQHFCSALCYHQKYTFFLDFSFFQTKEVITSWLER